VTGPKGVEYRIPPASLEALGYKVKVTQSGAVLTAARANLEAESLAVKVRELESSLEVEKIRREAAEQRSADLDSKLVGLARSHRKTSESSWTCQDEKTMVQEVLKGSPHWPTPL
jgi:hypothetical protein